jgi:uncharacterized protein
MTIANVQISPDSLRDLCLRYHISRLALFGSYITGKFTDASDIDVLAEFEPGHVPGFLFIRIQDELSEMFGRTVDLHTLNSLSKYFRDDVYGKAYVIYSV